jgi:hypothetical protein
MLRIPRRLSTTSHQTFALAVGPVRSSVLHGLLLAPLLVISSGCLCPPCAEAPQAAGGGDAGGGAKSAPATAATGDQLMVWDGDSVGGSAQGWADCDDKPGCKTKIGIASGEGVDGGAAVHLQGEGKKWIGMGWNWHGWWPKDAGTDISPYDTLRFDLRVVVADPKHAPEPSGMTVALRCSAGEKNSASVTLEKSLKNPGDGKWHAVEIPLAELYKGKEGQEFDPKSAWEMNLGTWAADSRSFDIYIDNISVTKK